MGKKGEGKKLGQSKRTENMSSSRSPGVTTTIAPYIEAARRARCTSQNTARSLGNRGGKPRPAKEDQRCIGEEGYGFGSRGWIPCSRAS